MKSLREQFEEDYAAVQVPAKNRQGFKIKYIYCAPWYIWGLPEKELGKKKNMLLAMSTGSFLLYLAAGIQNAAANRLMVSSIFSTIVLCAQIMELFGVFRFCFSQYKTNRMTYQEINRILYGAPLLRGGGLAALGIVGVACMITAEFDGTSFLIAAAYFLSGAIAFGIFGVYRKIPFRTEKNNARWENAEII